MNPVNESPVRILIEEEQVMDFIEETIEGVAFMRPDLFTTKCPHCREHIRHIPIARRSDIGIFKALIDSACMVMTKYGITGNLLADIKAQCFIEIARRGSKPD